ncbi:MAG: metal-sulfur cluster assembly factor [Lentilactobacillus diolivorans]|jgi:metal-sulfur cluster biosynthetic enzyme|nr:metal-sulfur cluster assembly factor [Lentilactobacillus diolivorans]MCH4164228.1 metal-sulfur cluster assembly factor [Lentilactobacillus diolivorans]MDH5104622.1 metal-sulfur cluster assembly factor [Lentilactobacillus diolivorans]RRG04774.1 MAG: metal-sulfur cluster assembly factor [Lactobacillus sp.]
MAKISSSLEDQVINSLEEVIDPELGVDIVNLGLIYHVSVVDQKCTLSMTLTTMGCPVGNLLADSIRQAVIAVEGITACDIKLVWEPAWDIGRMSRYAKVALGLHE